jgi:Zn-dependent peptidase ImmA (M78 family)
VAATTHPRVSRNRGAKRARLAREAFGLDDRSPVRCLLTVVEERFGTPVVVSDRLPDGTAGVCFRDGGRFVLWVNGRDAAVRQRFTLAHELGHAYIGHDGSLVAETIETLGGGTTTPHEIEANAFAAELLMPKAGIEELADLGRATLEEACHGAALFGVSALAFVIRLRTCGIVDDDRYARLKAEVDERLHEQVPVPAFEDRLGALDALPYLSPSLTGTDLDAAVHRRSAPDAELDAAVSRILL